MDASDRRATATRAGDSATAYRLCLITGSLVVGGAERFLTHLATALPEGVTVVVVGRSADVLAEVVPPRAVPLLVSTWEVHDLRAALRRAGPDVVHLNLTAFTSCRPALVASLLQRVPFVLVDHLPTPGLTWRGRAVQRLITRWAGARSAVGEASARLVEVHGGLPTGSVTSIPNAVPAVSDPVLRPVGAAPVLGVLCRLEHQKGVDVLLRALAGLPGVALEIAGDGPERAALEAQAEAAGVGDRVVFRGWLDDTQDFLGTIDVLVVPSRYEAMPLAVLEAMHCGLPVVATRVGSIPEVVVHDETGLLVNPNDADALEAALRQVVQDADFRSRAGQAGRLRASQRHGLEAMAAAYDDLYREVLSRRRMGRTALLNSPRRTARRRRPPPAVAPGPAGGV